MTHSHPPRTILVTGGAGYIGSHMVLALQQAGYEPIVLDNLSKGHRHAVIKAKLIVGDINDKPLLTSLFSTYRFAAVMHFASLIEVGESVNDPLRYYQNNLAGTLTLLETMLHHNINHFIFSSSAAVYGEPQYSPLDEAHPLNPINPYGRSKWMVENIIQDLAASAGLRFAILRYFNAAGADPAGQIGECHEPESHLIPLLLQVASGERECFTINGTDYPTPDGTCIRDFVHIMDICRAHLQALEWLLTTKQDVICNLGTGVGYSVAQLIAAVQRITQQPIHINKGPRRQGDPAILVANADQAKQILNWQPSYSALETIIQHAWRFKKTSNPFISNHFFS